MGESLDTRVTVAVAMGDCPTVYGAIVPVVAVSFGAGLLISAEIGTMSEP
jgi:hypothetical protein